MYIPLSPFQNSNFRFDDLDFIAFEERLLPYMSLRNDCEQWKIKFQESQHLANLLSCENIELKKELDAIKKEFRSQMSKKNKQIEDLELRMRSSRKLTIIDSEDEEDRRMRYFKECTKEIITTEMDYVNDLNLIIEVFHNFI